MLGAHHPKLKIAVTCIEVRHFKQDLTPSQTKAHLQTQGLGDLGGTHDPAVHAEAVTAGHNTLAAQLGQGVHGALAHAHVVGGDPGGEALQAWCAGGGGSGGRLV